MGQTTNLNWLHRRISDGPMLKMYKFLVEVEQIDHFTGFTASAVVTLKENGGVEGCSSAN